MRPKRSMTRSKILDAAYELFRRRGFSRVNVDEIAAAAGITKRTLYAHFPSKDALLEAVLETQHALALAAFDTFGNALTGTPEEIVRAFFRELKHWAARPRFLGSGFTRLAMELADMPGHPARRMASRHKLVLEQRLGDVFDASGLAGARLKARQIWILSEGVIALTMIHGDTAYCAAAEQAALELIKR